MSLKPQKRKCKTPHCRNAAAEGRTVCLTCKSVAYRKKNPLKAAFALLKSNAKRRGIEFKLTFEQFKEFAIETQVLVGRGRKKTSYHIDRIDALKGYEVGNLQVLTSSENSRKGAYEKVLVYDWRTGQGRFFGGYKEESNDDNVPF